MSFLKMRVLRILQVPTWYTLFIVAYRITVTYTTSSSLICHRRIFLRERRVSRRVVHGRTGDVLAADGRRARRGGRRRR